jgi:thiamine-phosphate pyrophosphorylase
VSHVTLQLDRFYPIVDSAVWVERLVRLGARLVQLRMKDQPDAVLRAHVRAAKAACASFGAQLVVNDHWQLAIEETCDFVHLGQGDLDDADLPALRNAGIRYGLSTHDYAELERAIAAEPAYIALGPIYPTSLKKMPWAPQGLFRIVEWKKLVGTTPLVAIGGLTVERLAGVFAAGADAAAVVTDIVKHPDPEARTKEWIAATRAVH